MKNCSSSAYKALCTEYYELDKPYPPEDALSCYLTYAAEAKGPILEPMCGTGRFLVPLLKKGYEVAGFDSSPDMLNICRAKCQKEGITPSLLEKASFENFSSPHTYQLIFIPSGSFSLLTKPAGVTQALDTVLKYLRKGGKFIFEIDTLKSVREPQRIWRGNWMDKSDGSKLVLNTLPQFNAASQVYTILCRYELWQNNKISKTEVENFQIRLYRVDEIEEILKRHGGLKVINKFVPYTKSRPDEKAESILYECMKI